MCGIIAVLRRPSRRQPPTPADLLERLDAAVEAAARLDTLAQAAAGAEAVDEALRGVPGVRALLADPGLTHTLDTRCERLEEAIAKTEIALDAGEVGILRTAAEVAALGGGAGLPDPAVEAYTSIQTALSAIDRLEVRGPDLADPEVRRRFEERAANRLLTSRAYDGRTLPVADSEVATPGMTTRDLLTSPVHVLAEHWRT